MIKYPFERSISHIINLFKVYLMSNVYQDRYANNRHVNRGYVLKKKKVEYEKKNTRVYYIAFNALSQIDYRTFLKCTYL